MPPGHKDPIAEADRLLVICNACRYCEGYCAVFPAMERRIEFDPSTVRQLANLCHNCAECYYACQYAPPHEFAVNVPKVLAEARAISYRDYAWPSGLWRKGAFGFPWFLLSLLAVRWLPVKFGATFYEVLPHEYMVAIFGAAAGWVALALGMGLRRAWLDRPPVTAPITAGAFLQGCKDAFALKNLSSGGTGCTYPNEHHSNARRWWHHLTFYGFALCFASTTVAAIYHVALGWVAPYAYTSVPVILGTLGGVGLLVGPLGLLALKLRRDPEIVDKKQDGMDLEFLIGLWLVSSTGLALLVLRDSEWMRDLLMLHLAFVMGLFLSLPYGKFVHGLYRLLALVRDAAEKASLRSVSHGE